MYIALKWLIALGFILWVSLCFLDSQIKIKKYQHELLKGLDQNLLNKGASIIRKLNYPFSRTILTIATVTTFLLVAFIKHYHNKNLEEEKPSGFFVSICDLCWSVLEVFKIRNFILNVKYYMMKILQTGSTKMVDSACNTLFFVPHHGELSQKLLEVSRENKNLKKIMNSNLAESRKVYKAYKQECAEREKLSEQINFMQIQMKEKTALFQKHHFKMKNENKGLREEVRRLSFTTNESEMKLRRLIREIFRSKNKQLKTFCDNLMLHKDSIRSRRHFEKDALLKDLCVVTSVPSVNVKAFGTDITSEQLFTMSPLKMANDDITIMDSCAANDDSITNFGNLKFNKNIRNASLPSTNVTPSSSLLQKPYAKNLVTGSLAFKNFLSFDLRTQNI